ncbi:hypothetical protein N7478_000603 [Penicillium angulare]|uniref:uncharacterized protein n=1 Tax=Penicillium angulare TaxID=116970 RepID=UPI0025420A79|nr:uncharacterized protein N7478_000603 [Penicillium angulare]KAJ5291352.1 hypothetical protein N7478_000603 [Penicillium angulare]
MRTWTGQFVDETITISNEYQDGTQKIRVGSSRQNNERIHHSTGAESAGTPIQTTSTQLEQRTNSPAIDYDPSGIDFGITSISPTNRATPQSIIDSNSTSIGLDSFEDVDCHVHLSEVPNALEDAPSHIPINTPTSWEIIRQREDAAGQALLSMRNNNPGAQLTRSSMSESSPSIQCSPMVDSDLSPQGTYLGQDIHDTSISSVSKEETDLLRQFSVEVGTWMDLSDLSETFSKTVCRLAVQDPLLKAACIACAAKQQYIVGKMHNGMQIAQKNYDVAISLLINRLSDSNEQLAGYGFAAIVICSCYEMLDAPTINWQRHLDGVFSFGKVQKVNGSSGGVAQAAFWSIARQEVACAIINRSRLRLDPEYWVVDLENIGQEGSEDMINNQVLAILAKVVALMAYSQTHSLTKTIDEWHKLYAQLEHWESSVKNKGFMDPVSVLNDEGKVFQTIWFVRSVCGQYPLSLAAFRLRQ